MWFVREKRQNYVNCLVFFKIWASIEKMVISKLSRFYIERPLVDSVAKRVERFRAGWRIPPAIFFSPSHSPFFSLSFVFFASYEFSIFFFFNGTVYIPTFRLSYQYLVGVQIVPRHAPFLLTWQAPDDQSNQKVNTLVPSDWHRQRGERCRVIFLIHVLSLFFFL
jgi:hypothetical protein